MAAPPAWMEKVLVTIDRYESAEVSSISGFVDRNSLDISVGNKPMETIPVLSQGRVYKYSPDEDTEVSFDLYVKDLGTTSGGALDLWFIGTTGTTSGKIDVVNTMTRDKFRVTLLFTNDPVPTTATTTVNSTGTPAYAARRYILADAFITSYKPSFTDGILKVKCSIKIPAFDASAVSNIGFQSLDGTTTGSLAALSDYTGTTKGYSGW